VTPVAASKTQDPTDDDRSDETWVRAAGGETSIRLRSLSHYLSKGGSIVDARLLEDAEGTYSVWVRLGDRPGEFCVNQFQYDKPKTYRDLNLAVATLRNEFGYYGAIALQTEKRAARAGG
jgi:hypothetical protein